jgi:hypothetical protein
MDDCRVRRISRAVGLDPAAVLTTLLPWASFLTLAGCLPAVGQEGEWPQFCELEVRAVHAHGGRLPSPRVKIDDRSVETDRSGVVHAPCGERKVTVYLEGFWPREIKVNLRPRRTLEIVRLDIGMVGEADRRANAQFQLAHYERLRGCDAVRVVSELDREWQTASTVSQNGRFGLEDLPMGNYLVLLFDSTGRCGIGEFTVSWPPQSEYLIEVNPSRPKPDGSESRRP